MEREQIYNYSQPKEIVTAILRERQKRNPNYSLRAWAKQLGLANHTLLSLIMRGKRKLKASLAQKMIASLNLGKKERKYFELLVLLDNAKDVVERELYQDMINHLHPHKTKVHHVEIDYFRVIADWYHFAILEMIALKDFRYDVGYIAKRLGTEVSAVEVEQALERMIRLQLVEVDAKGVLRRGNEGDSLLVEFQGASEAIRKHHSQMIDKAKKAITEQKIDERNLRATTLSIKEENKKELIEVIKRFHREIEQYAVSDGSGDQVYQLNTQFFRLTTGEIK